MTKLEIRAGLPTEHTLEGFEALFAQPDNQAIAADRASRQVANKAEVDLSSLNVQTGADIELVYCNRDEEFVRLDDVKALLATPPATTGASTELRPTDDELWDATLRDRDAYHDWADKLADAIAKHFGVDIGEHSNQNLPWAEALEVIENAERVGASTVLTDERIHEIVSENVDCSYQEGLAFARAIEREIAAPSAPGTPEAPANVEKALRELMAIVRIHSRATDENFAWAEMQYAEEVLRAAQLDGGQGEGDGDVE